jgi:hypothetical protein
VGNGAVPRERSRRGDLILLGAAATAWLLPWLLLTGAAAVSGGHPDESPVDFINPLRLVGMYWTDGNAVVWWHLVGATQPAHVWLFAAFIIAALVVMLAALVASLLVWAGGVPGVGAAMLLVPGRLQHTSRWATWRDAPPRHSGGGSRSSGSSSTSWPMSCPSRSCPRSRRRARAAASF